MSREAKTFWLCVLKGIVITIGGLLATALVFTLLQLRVTFLHVCLAYLCFLVVVCTELILSKLKAESISFTNHYTPAYITAGTFNTEFISQTGLLPSVTGLSSSIYSTNSFPFSLAHQFSQQGYTVAAIHKGESLTAKVDTGFLWKLAALDAAAAKAGKSVAKLLEGGAAV